MPSTSWQMRIRPGTVSGSSAKRACHLARHLHKQAHGAQLFDIADRCSARNWHPGNIQDPFHAQVEWFPRGDQQNDRRRGLHDIAEQARAIQEVLEIVEDQQELSGSEVGEQLGIGIGWPLEWHLEGGRDRRNQELGRA
jgi:hypothetical protein